MDILVYAYMIPSVRRRSFVQRLDEIRRNGHNVVVVSAGSEVRVETEFETWKVPQVMEKEVTWFLNALLYVFFGLWYGVRLHRQHSFDLVRADFADVPGFTAALFSGMFRLPFVLYCHGRNHLEHPFPEPVASDDLPYKVLGKKDARYWLVKASLRRADAVHVVSELYGCGFDCETEVVYPSVDTDSFTPSTKENLIVSVGALQDVKNLDTAIAAVEGRKGGWEYVIVGDGPARKRLEEQAEKTRFVGGAGTETVAEYVGKAKIFMLPSFYETFGVAYLEALAAGTPIICGEKTGIAEVIEDGVHGVVVDSREVDEIVEAITAIEESYEEMSSAARELAEKFDVRASARQVVGEYEEIVERHGSAT